MITQGNLPTTLGKVWVGEVHFKPEPWLLEALQRPCPCRTGSLLTCNAHIADATNGGDFVQKDQP